MDGSAGRGGVPDLLFEDVCGARVEELRPFLDAPESAGAGTPLHRVTVFLTYRCNLACPYCKTIARTPRDAAAWPQKAVRYDVPRFEALLRRLGDMPVRHLHFTGGEAALVPGVEAMAALARRAGIAQLSMTSNGTAPPARYAALVRAGMTEVRISIDAHEAALGAQLTGRCGAWPRSVEALRALVAARDAGAEVRVLANVVVGRDNRARLVDLVRFLLALGPDDVKLITEVDERDALPDFGEREAVERGLAQLLAAAPPDALPLLRRKLRTVFARDAIGLGPTAGARTGVAWRCYVPLSERTVDGVAYYPCSVYLREGGAPIGRLDDDAEAQRRATAAWVRETDCREDPICRRYCLLCTRTYNDAANAARTDAHAPSPRNAGVRGHGRTRGTG